MPSWYGRLSQFRERSWARGITQLLDTVLPFLLIVGAMGFVMVSGWPYWIAFLLAFPAALFLVRTFIIFHDCTHGSFFPSDRANRIVGFLTGVLTFTPFEPWRISHLKHHATNGRLDHRGVGDVYTMTYEEYKSAGRTKRLGYRLYRNPLVMFVLGPIYTFILVHRVHGLDGNRRSKRSVLLTNLAIGLIAVGVSLAFGFRVYLGVQLPVILISGTMGIWLFYVQHQFDPGYWKHDEKWDRYDAAMYGASYYKLPHLLRWFTGNIGVHHLHHLQPRIPNYALYRAYTEVPQAQIPEPLTFWKSLASVRINLWSEVQERFLSFREAHRMMRGQHARAG